MSVTLTPLTVPEAHLPILELLERLDQPQFDVIVRRLAVAQPRSHPLDLAQVLNGVSVLEDTAAGFLSTLASMYLARYRERLSAEVFSKAVTGDLERRWSRDSGSLQTLQDRLTSLLGLDASVGVTAKAYFLREEGQRVLTESPRIVTDIRPIFVEQELPAPVASIVLHLLHLRYQDGDAIRDLTLAVDHTDLLELSHLIERALQKEQVLRPALRNTVFKTLDSEELAE